MNAQTKATRGNGLNWLLGMAAFVIIVAGMKAAQSLLVPFLIAAFLAVLCAPTLQWLQERGRSTTFSLFLVVFAVSMVFMVVVIVVGTSINDFSGKIDGYQKQLTILKDDAENWLKERGVPIPENNSKSIEESENSGDKDAHDNGTTDNDTSDSESKSPEGTVLLPEGSPESDDTTKEPGDDEAKSSDATNPSPEDDKKPEDSTEASKENEEKSSQEVEADDSDGDNRDSDKAEPGEDDSPKAVPVRDSSLDIFSLLKTVLNSLAGLLSNAFIVLLTFVFIMFEASGIPSKLASAFGGEEAQLSRVREMGTAIRDYVSIKTWVSLVTAGLIAIWLSILNVEYVFVWALLAFFFNFVPNIGSIIAAVPPVLITLLRPGVDLQTALTVAAFTAAGYLVVNIVVGNVLEPRIMGKGLGLSTLVVFVSLAFWGWVLGPVGMLFSVPLTMIVKIALESSDDTHWLLVLLEPEKQAVKKPAAPDGSSSIA